MATSMLPLRPPIVTARAGSGNRKTDASSRKSSSSSNWWSPLFGLSGEPDYLRTVESKTDPDPDPKQARTRFSPGAFTEEKAKQLRRLTMETSSFHDVMYHSAIASRLASDFTDISTPGTDPRL
nr:Transcription activator of gluconeogenesis [Ipomoea batatas]